MQPLLSRRAFCTTATLVALQPHILEAQTASSRPDVAAIDHDRILTAANKALATAPTLATPLEYTALAAALLLFSRQVSALAAAFHLTREDRYAAHAVLHLRAWFIAPATYVAPDMIHVGQVPSGNRPNFEHLVDDLPLAEIAVAIPFLASSSSLFAEDYAGLQKWSRDYLSWLTTSRIAGLARDQKDHHGTSWLLQAVAFARLTGDEAILAELRHRFKTVTLRAQLVSGGTFPHELSTAYPYRNSLFALDLLSGSCHLLSTPFESLWEYELQDGPGVRSAVAFHAPFIQKRNAWPYRADLMHFADLPVRCPSLLFAARAYQRPEYAELWKTLNPDPTIPELQRTFPISQPLLWMSRPVPRRA